MHFRGKCDEKKCAKRFLPLVSRPSFSTGYVRYVATAFRSNHDQLNYVNPNLTIHINR